MGMLALATLYVTGAAAQAPPPFEPGRADERVSMELALENITTPTNGGYVEIFTDDVARVDDFQQGAADDGGRLEMFPSAVLFLFPDSGLGSLPLDDEGTRSFVLLKGGAPELFGEYPYSRACPQVGSCQGFLDGPIESESEARFDVVAGTLDGSAHVSTRTMVKTSSMREASSPTSTTRTSSLRHPASI